jgi:viroplasmin and RNaseH domain-containing protein
MTWYVVYRGKQSGVYDSWAKCNEQVVGFKKNSYKGFKTKEEADASFLEYMGSLLRQLLHLLIHLLLTATNGPL